MSEAARGVSYVASMVSGRLATQAVLLVSALVIPRVLGVEDFGRYSAVMALIAIVQIVSDPGLGQVAIQFLSPLWSSGRRGATTTLGSTVWLSRLWLAIASGLLAAALLALPSGEIRFGPAVLAALAALTFLRGGFEATRTLLLPLGRAGAMASLEVLRAVLTLVVVVVAYRAAGLAGVFAGLPMLYALLTVAAVVVLMRVLPLSPRHFDWRALRPHARFGALVFSGHLAIVVQAQFAIYAVAIWAAPREAGLLSLTLQISVLFRGLLVTAQGALMTILADLDSRDETRRLSYWGGLIMRYGAAVAVIATVGWAFLGGDFLRLALGPSYLPVHLAGTVVLGAMVLWSCGSPAATLLTIRRRPGLTALAWVMHAAVTVLGLWLVLDGGAEGAHLRVAWVYAIAAAVFFPFCYLTLGVVLRMWLPLRRTLTLILPALVAWPATLWQAPLALRLVALIAFIAVYAGLGVRFGLLPREELRALVGAARQAFSGSRGAGDSSWPQAAGPGDSPES